MVNKRTGRPPMSGQKKVFFGVYLDAEQLAWLRKQQRPAAEIIRALIAEKIGADND